jgi:predicted P-loop ATPase
MIEHIKALLSRQSDRGRLAYDRITSEVPRQCVIIGTTNDRQYLKDTTGNRRFWPVSIERFDVEALKQDRDQLWAEAAAREAQGESIRLKRELWPKAALEQDQRLASDPFLDALEDVFSGREGKIKASDVWKILGIQVGHATQDHNMRLGKAMRTLGWVRPPSGTARFGGKPVSAYVKGEKRIKDGRGQPEWAEISVTWSKEAGLLVFGGELKDPPF